jgi:hypothetical protein
MTAITAYCLFGIVGPPVVCALLRNAVVESKSSSHTLGQARAASENSNKCDDMRSIDDRLVAVRFRRQAACPADQTVGDSRIVWSSLGARMGVPSNSNDAPFTMPPGLHIPRHPYKRRTPTEEAGRLISSNSSVGRQTSPAGRIDFVKTNEITRPHPRDASTVQLIGEVVHANGLQRTALSDWTLTTDAGDRRDGDTRSHAGEDRRRSSARRPSAAPISRSTGLIHTRGAPYHPMT